MFRCIYKFLDVSLTFKLLCKKALGVYILNNIPTHQLSPLLTLTKRILEKENTQQNCCPDLLKKKYTDHIQLYIELTDFWLWGS